MIAVPAAFAFCFAKFPGKRFVYVLYIVLMMMPLQVMILPNYIGLRDLGLLNTRAAVILLLIFSPLGVVVMWQYMDGAKWRRLKPPAWKPVPAFGFYGIAYCRS